MRWRRFFTWLGVAVALLALAAAGLLLPAVQRALLRRALAASGATGIRLGEFRASPFGVEAERIEFTRGPLHVNALGLRLELKPLGLLHRRVDLTRVAAGQVDVTWDFDVSARELAALAAAGGSPPPLFGVIQRSPWPLAIDATEANGRLIFLRGGAPVFLGRWQLHGGGIAPGRTGTLAYDLEASSPGLIPGGPLRLAGAIAATEGISGEILAVTLTGSAAAKTVAGPLAPARFGFKAVPRGKDEAYTAHASFGPDLMADATGSFSPGDQLFQIYLQVAARPRVAAQFPLPREWLDSDRSIKGSVDLALSTKTFVWSLPQGALRLSGGATGPAFSLALAQPMPLGASAGLGPLAVLRLEHIPLAWANPWLAPHGVKLESGELRGAWNLRLVGDTVELASAEPLTLGPLRLSGAGIPQVGTWTLRSEPTVTIAQTQARLRLEKFVLEDERGHRLQVSAEAALTWEKALGLSVSRCEVAAGRASGGLAVLEASLLRPLSVDLAHPAEALDHLGTGELLRVKGRDLPLGWLSRWLPGRRIEGSVAAGETRVANVEGRGLVLSTPVPWRMAELRLSEGGREYFHGRLQASPAGVYGPKERWFRLEDLAAEDSGNGRRLHGRIGAALRSGDARVGGLISLEAYLPHVPRLGGGAVAFRISALAHATADGKGELARFSLVAVNSQNKELATITADQPISVERTADAEWLVSSPKPLRFTTGRVSLAALNPLLAPRGIAIDGAIPATELWLHLSPRKLRLESKAPLAISRFRLDRDGTTLITRARLRCGLALDVDVEHRLLPVFRLKSAVDLRLTNGGLSAEGAKIARFDAHLGLAGTEKTAALRDIGGSLWLDLGALGRMPFLATARLPAQGELTATLKKNPDKAHSFQLEAKVEHLVGRTGTAAPVLTVTGRAGGDLSQKIAGFRVQARLLSTPRPTDLRFGMRVDFGKLAILDLSSKLEGDYIDADAIRAFADAFSPSVPPPAAVPPVAAPAAAKGKKAGALALAGAKLRPPEAPPWGIVRGHFTLALKTVVLSPYTIEHLGGRLDLTDDSLKLSQLSGDFLNGRWSADIAAQLHPGDPAGDKGLEAHLRFIQLDAGRAVRMRYPKPPAGIDGLLDLNIALASKAARWEDLLAKASGNFTLEGHEGRMRLALPKAEMAANGLLLGGALTFSSELRALGRLVGHISEMPIGRVQASGTLGSNGELQLQHIDLESPGLKIVGTGQIADAKTRDLMAQPLSMRANLSASGDLAVILAGMHLLGPAGPDGYRAMDQPFLISGNVGQPDFHALFDLLARAAGDSHGSWGILMRKVQAEVDKRRGKAK